MSSLLLNSNLFEFRFAQIRISRGHRFVCILMLQRCPTLATVHYGSAGPGRCVHRPGENFVLFSAKYCTELRNGVLGHLRFFPITSNMYLDGFFDRSEKYWKIKNSHGATFCSILRFGGAKSPEQGERKAPAPRENQIIVPYSELRPS